MPELETGLMDILQADPVLSGLVTTIAASDRLPDDTDSGPALCFWCMHDVPATTMQGVASAAMPVYQFHFYAKKLADVKAIRHAVKNLLDGYSGTTTSGVQIDSIIPYAGGQIPYQPDTLLYGWELAYTITWQEYYY